MQLNIRKIHRYFVESTLLIVASYFIVRKATNFSGSGLIKQIFMPAAGEIIVIILTCVVFYALLARIVIYTHEFFKKIDAPSLGFPHYRCLLNNNKEIEKHLKELKCGVLSLDNICERHSYEENMQIIHRNFSEHLFASLKDKNKDIGGGDIFLSLFHDDEFDIDFENISTFSYSSHYDPTLHNTVTSELNLGNQKFNAFAGIRAIKKKNTVICYKVKKGNYEVGKEERRKSIKHYIGIPLKINGSVVGLLNVEFHNKNIFSSADEMKLFYQKEIQSFVYLYEYQMHKKYFFKHLKNKVVEL
ncbi:MAG TPA: hypothetical protein DCX54_13500 [Flavobacteriales bacterium]|nr:hypothetical protein [Flavobacteriales bacterium]